MVAAGLLGLAGKVTLLPDDCTKSRIIALVCLAMLPLVVTALWHGRIRVDEHSISWLGIGFTCRRIEVPWSRIQRHGSTLTTERGYKQRILLLELDDGSVRTIRLSLYRDPLLVLLHLTQRLGLPTPAVGTLTGARFE
jgi:hypothetical protein